MIQKPKGTYDVYGEYGKKIKYVEELFEGLMEKYNYEYFRTPIFESSNLYHRGVGETTDIVTKETYDFKDRGERDMTLRPEGTAGIVRSYIENKLYGDQSLVKAWYYGPNFRYERPQSGRFREFYQFGCEVFGSNDPMLDAEIISIPVMLYKLLGLKGIKVNINSLGDKESRDAYHKALINYFKPYINDLCEDCRERFLKNPLRILDCKVDSESDIIKNAPKMVDYLNEISKKHFLDLQKYLKALDIDYVINDKLVRGLDYYTHTVFEVEADIEGFGSQKVLCGGGRYDNLVENLGGPKMCGVGFAFGLERLMKALEYENIDMHIHNCVDCYIIPMDESVKDYAFNITLNLRLNGFVSEIDYNNRNLKNNFKYADKIHSNFVIIIGEDEYKSDILTIKDNHTKESYKVKKDELVEFLDNNIEECDCE